MGDGGNRKGGLVELGISDVGDPASLLHHARARIPSDSYTNIQLGQHDKEIDGSNDYGTAVPVAARNETIPGDFPLLILTPLICRSLHSYAPDTG